MAKLNKRTKALEGKVDQNKAYDVLQQALIKNPYSVLLMKEYVRYCGRYGNSRFGMLTLQDLEGKIPDDDYIALYMEFQKDIIRWQTSF